jgi:hypothetical protein
MLRELESKPQQNNEQRRQEPERRKKREERKTRPESCLGEEPTETATERRITISQNSRMALPTKPMKTKPIHNHKREYDPGINKRPQSGKDARLLSLFLKQDIMKLTIKAWAKCHCMSK